MTTDEDKIRQILFSIYAKYGSFIIDALIDSIAHKITLRMNVDSYAQDCTNMYNSLSKDHKELKKWKFIIK